MAVSRQSNSNKAVFLDKDGTLVHDVPYNVDPVKIELFNDTVSSLRQLQTAGYKLIIVTNQSGVARGMFGNDEAHAAVHSLIDILAISGIEITTSMICPHHPDGTVEEFRRTCLCRKPQPGMLLAAAERHGIDLKQSWMVGDILDDIEAGNRAGCRSLLINNGGETEWQYGGYRTPHKHVTCLGEAAQVILQDKDMERSPYEQWDTGYYSRVH